MLPQQQQSPASKRRNSVSITRQQLQHEPVNPRTKAAGHITWGSATTRDEQLRASRYTLKSEIDLAQQPHAVDDAHDSAAAQKLNAETLQQLQELENMYGDDEGNKHGSILTALNRILALLNFPLTGVVGLNTIDEICDRSDDIKKAMKKDLLEIEAVQHNKQATASSSIPFDETDEDEEEFVENDDEDAMFEPIPTVAPAAVPSSSAVANCVEICESALKISHDNFSTTSISSAHDPQKAASGSQPVSTSDSSTMTTAVAAPPPPPQQAHHPAPAAPSTAAPMFGHSGGASFTVDIKDPKTGKRVHSFQSPAPAAAGAGSSAQSEEDVNMTAFTTAAALAGFREMVKVDVFVRPDMILASDVDGASENDTGAGKVTIELNSRELCGRYQCAQT